MSNKKAGDTFEQEFCDMLADKGYWAHNMAARRNGQPADVIAVKNRSAYLIDCKVCERDVFELKRIEENQHCAMDLWERCGNGIGLFALKTSAGVFMITYTSLKMLEAWGHKSLNMGQILTYGEAVEWRM